MGVRASGTKASPGGDGHQRGRRLRDQMRQQRGGEPHGAEQIGGEDGFGIGETAPDAAAPASDQNGVAAHLHGGLLR